MYRVTAVILTYNEEPNIVRVLESLTWCERIVVLDSGSTDRTKERALGFPTVSWFTRPFDNHATQWRFALFETGISTDLALALDSDMIVPAAFREELNSRFLPEHAGAVLTFRYCSLGCLLKGSLYPPQLRLLRLSQVSVRQRGHTQEFLTEGPLYTFKTRCIHDDRKPVERWLHAQMNYSALESQRIASSGRNPKDVLRKIGLMPLIAGGLGYVRAGGPLSGKAALNYAYERMAFELMLTLRLLRGGSHAHDQHQS
jgi:Glycosyl transferase family 2